MWWTWVKKARLHTIYVVIYEILLHWEGQGLCDSPGPQDLLQLITAVMSFRKKIWVEIMSMPSCSQNFFYVIRVDQLISNTPRNISKHLIYWTSNSFSCLLLITSGDISCNLLLPFHLVILLSSNPGFILVDCLNYIQREVYRTNLNIVLAL